MDKYMITKNHPAPFPKKIIESIRWQLRLHKSPVEVPRRLLDPFAGIGTVHSIDDGWEYYGCEIEPEWAAQAQGKGLKVHVGDARHMPWPEGFFGAVVTSPTYGNRYADNYLPDMSDPKNKDRRNYQISLGRKLTPGNTGAFYWGDEYRAIHEEVWRECCRVLATGGQFVLNCKDYVRKGTVQPVTEWHVLRCAPRPPDVTVLVAGSVS